MSPRGRASRAGASWGRAHKLIVTIEETDQDNQFPSYDDHVGRELFPSCLFVCFVKPATVRIQVWILGFLPAWRLLSRVSPPPSLPEPTGPAISPRSWMILDDLTLGFARRISCRPLPRDVGLAYPLQRQVTRSHPPKSRRARDSV
jgi:hypothetical protein